MSRREVHQLDHPHPEEQAEHDLRVAVDRQGLQVLIVDEALAVGDAAFQQKCRARIEALRADGTALVLASHAFAEVKETCERALWLDEGAVRAAGPSAEVVDELEAYLRVT